MARKGNVVVQHAFAVFKHLLLFGDGLTLWSISVEFQFYAIFVGLWLLGAALPQKHRIVDFALVCVGLGASALDG